MYQNLITEIMIFFVVNLSKTQHIFDHMLVIKDLIHASVYIISLFHISADMIFIFIILKQA